MAIFLSITIKSVGQDHTLSFFENGTITIGITTMINESSDGPHGSGINNKLIIHFEHVQSLRKTA